MAEKEKNYTVYLEDWLPSNRKEILLMALRWCVLMPHWAPIREIPEADIAELRAAAYAAKDVWDAGQAARLLTDSSADEAEYEALVEKWHGVLDGLVRIARRFKKRFLDDSYLLFDMEWDFRNSDYPEKEALRYLVPKAVTTPALLCWHGEETARLSIAVKDNWSGRGIVPYGMAGVRYRLKVLEDGEPVPAHDQAASLPATELISDFPYVREFRKGGDKRSGDSGKRAAWSVCWENDNGEQGPFGGVWVAHIP
jgi:hypothetical protein